VANRDKKEAREALDELKTYLRRDQRGRELLDTVERYMAELRRKNSELTDTVARQDVTVKESTKAKDVAVSRAETVTQELTVEKSRNQSLQLHLATAKQEVESLQAEIRGEVLEGGEADYTRITQLFLDVRHRLPKCPDAISIVGDIAIFSTGQFIKNFTDAEFVLLGKFLTYLSIFANKPTAIRPSYEHEKLQDAWVEMSEKSRKRQVVKWSGLPQSVDAADREYYRKTSSAMPTYPQ